MHTYSDLIAGLREKGVLRSQRLEDALMAIDRGQFVPHGLEHSAYQDHALPIGQGQTISQPLTVAFMLELLEPQEGDHALDVGSGSGWTAALLAHMVGERGDVTSLEIEPGLAAFARANLAKYPLLHAQVHERDGRLGMPERAPFERILVSATTDSPPKALLEQLAPGGRMVVPVSHSLLLVEKDADGALATKEYVGFLFVPLRDPQAPAHA